MAARLISVSVALWGVRAQCRYEIWGIKLYLPQVSPGNLVPTNLRMRMNSREGYAPTALAGIPTRVRGFIARHANHSTTEELNELNKTIGKKS